MNLFGSFSFSRLIKTFLPGLVLSLSILIYLDIFIFLLSKEYIIYNLAIANTALFTIILIPSSVIMGIFSNIIFFTFARKYIIDNNFQLNNSRFCEFEDSITKLIKNDLIIKMNLKGENSNMFNEFIDIKSFYLNKIEVEKISFIKDSFLYYLDFQLNILLAINFLIPSIIYIIIKQSIKNSVHWATITTIILILLILVLLVNKIFIKSSRMNYKHYKIKYLSLIVGSFYFKNNESINKK